MVLHEPLILDPLEFGRSKLFTIKFVQATSWYPWWRRWTDPSPRPPPQPPSPPSTSPPRRTVARKRKLNGEAPKTSSTLVRREEVKRAPEEGLTLIYMLGSKFRFLCTGSLMHSIQYFCDLRSGCNYLIFMEEHARQIHQNNYFYIRKLRWKTNIIAF